MSDRYKFNEDKLIEEFKRYVDSTYDSHYGTGGIQSLEVISDRGRGLDFCLGNVDKYNDRYGEKGRPSDWRKDILKIIHYGFLALNEHDKIHSVEGLISDYDIEVGDILLDDIFDADSDDVTVAIADDMTPDIFFLDEEIKL